MSANSREVPGWREGCGVRTLVHGRKAGGKGTQVVRQGCPIIGRPVTAIGLGLLRLNDFRKAHLRC